MLGCFGLHTWAYTHVAKVNKGLTQWAYIAQCRSLHSAGELGLTQWAYIVRSRGLHSIESMDLHSAQEIGLTQIGLT